MQTLLVSVTEVLDGVFEAVVTRNGARVYATTRAGDAQRAHNAALAGYGVVDHHGRTFVRGVEVECRCLPIVRREAS